MSNALKTRIPELRFPEFTGEWVEKRLGEISIWKSGGTPSKERPDYWNGDIPWISASSMHDYKIDDSEFKLTELGLKNGTRLTKQGTLLLLVRGSMLYNRIPLGIAQRDVAFNQDVKSIDAGRETNVFLLPWFQAKEHLLLSMVTGTGIGAGKLETSDLKNLKIRFPDFYEQKKIASFLSAVDRRIEGLEKKRDLLKDYKKGLMQKLFNQSLRFGNGDRPFPEWEEKRLGDIAVGGFSNGVFNDPNKVGSGYRLINVKDMYLGSFVNTESLSRVDIDSKEFSKNKVESGDIFFTRSSLVKEGIAESNVCLTNATDITYDGHLIRMRIDKNLTDPLCLSYCLKTGTVRRQLVARGKTTTMTTIGQDDIASVRITVPFISEQKKIAECLSAIDRKIEQVETQVARTREFKQGLLQKMFV
jgi:type I restriction enzyme S subunit